MLVSSDEWFLQQALLSSDLTKNKMIMKKCQNYKIYLHLDNAKTKSLVTKMERTFSWLLLFKVPLTLRIKTFPKTPLVLTSFTIMISFN